MRKSTARVRSTKDGGSGYRRLGFVSLNYPRSTSRTVEYAYDDFCIAQVARTLGKPADSRKYLERSKNWMNVWSDETRSARPRYADGRWLTPFDAAHFYPDKDYSYWDAPFYEGSGYIYGTYVPHDAQGLINKLGSDERFITWLDASLPTLLHVTRLSTADSTITITSPTSWPRFCTFMPAVLIAHSSVCGTS